jgi:hypothetical protein
MAVVAAWRTVQRRSALQAAPGIAVKNNAPQKTAKMATGDFQHIFFRLSAAGGRVAIVKTWRSDVR